MSQLYPYTRVLRMSSETQEEAKIKTARVVYGSLHDKIAPYHVS